VRLSTALLALARGALTLGAFKTARLAYARLQVSADHRLLLETGHSRCRMSSSSRPALTNSRGRRPLRPRQARCQTVSTILHPHARSPRRAPQSPAQALALPPEARADAELQSVMVRKPSFQFGAGPTKPLSFPCRMRLLVLDNAIPQSLQTAACAFGFRV
jgi:hypothetical protein